MSTFTLYTWLHLQFLRYESNYYFVALVFFLKWNTVKDLNLSFFLHHSKMSLSVKNLKGQIFSYFMLNIMRSTVRKYLDESVGWKRRCKVKQFLVRHQKIIWFSIEPRRLFLLVWTEDLLWPCEGLSKQRKLMSVRGWISILSYYINVNV